VHGAANFIIGGLCPLVPYPGYAVYDVGEVGKSITARPMLQINSIHNLPNIVEIDQH